MRSYRLPPLGAVKAFDAVATCGSFKQAAQQIGVTPTAISHQIRLLEQFLDTPLFIRGARQVQLTAAGQRLLQASTRAFADLLSAVEDIQRAKSPPTLTLTTTSNFLTHWLVPRLALMKACCPALDLRLHTSLDVMNLAHNAVDVAIRYSMAPDEALDATLLYEDSFIAVASPALGLTPQGGLLTAILIHVEDRHIPHPRRIGVTGGRCTGRRSSTCMPVYGSTTKRTPSRPPLPVRGWRLSAACWRRIFWIKPYSARRLPRRYRAGVIISSPRARNPSARMSWR